METVLDVLRLRRRIRLSLTAMRVSQVENLELPWKLVELFVGFQKSVLRDVFGVFAVLGDVLGDAEDLPLVLADELSKGAGVAGAGALDKGNVGGESPEFRVFP